MVTAFGAASVSILAISQGSSERNISIVIKTKDARVALKAVHDMFYVPLESIYAFLTFTEIFKGNLVYMLP